MAGFQSGAVQLLTIEYLTNSLLDGSIKAPKQRKLINLRSPHNIPNLYERLLTHVSKIWPELKLSNDRRYSDGLTPFYAHSTTHSLAFILKNGLRYGSTAAIRTNADIYACVDIDGSRCPCEIAAHFEVTISEGKRHYCSIIRRFDGGEDLPSMPWDMQ